MSCLYLSLFSLWSHVFLRVGWQSVVVGGGEYRDPLAVRWVQSVMAAQRGFDLKHFRPRPLPGTKPIHPQHLSSLFKRLLKSKGRKQSELKRPPLHFSHIFTFLLCFVMALKRQSAWRDTWETEVQHFCLPEGPHPSLALQHVIMAHVIIVISVVVEVRTVIGGCDQGEGSVVVFRVQWFLLNADVMPTGEVGGE